jgi:Zn-dependent protease with chaperone function
MKGFFAGKKRSVFGIPVTRAEQPEVWETCDKAAKRVGTIRVDKIYISPQPGIGVHLSGGLLSLLIGRAKRTLTIGLGSIPCLSISEGEAILAHEFGHFSNKDTAWNSLTFTMAGALQNTLITMPNPWNSSGWIKLTSALNPALWVLLGYRFLFAVVTSGFSRTREVFADKTAIGLYGYKNFVTGLMKVGRNDYLFSGHLVPQMVKILTEEGKIFTNLFYVLEQMHKSMEDGEFSRSLSEYSKFLKIVYYM